MVQNKNQHYVPKFYFNLFSKNRKTICAFNIPDKVFIEHATIKGQCSKGYFYSKNPEIEKSFSWLEGLANRNLKKIIENGSLSYFSEEEKHHLKSHILFQHGRTKYAYDRENEIANYMFDSLKPKFYQKAKESGQEISWDLIKDMKIVLNSSSSLILSMMSGILLYDLDIVLLENKTKVDFIFSDNPVVFFNSYFNDSHPYGTIGMASTGLQIFYPINSKLMIYIFDSNFYSLTDLDIIKIYKSKDIQRLNGLQIINCDKNIYFEDINQKGNIIERYNQIKSKKPQKKSEYEVMGSRIAENGTYRELVRTSSPKIKYKLKKLSFLKHKNTNIEFGIRNPELMGINRKIVHAVEDGKIKSMDDLSNFLKENFSED